MIYVGLGMNTLQKCSWGGTLDHGQALRDFLADGSHLSARDTKGCEGLITAAEVIEVLGDCPRQKSLG